MNFGRENDQLEFKKSTNEVKEAMDYFIDDRSQDTIWEYNKPKVNDLHPTMKPLELVGRAIKKEFK